MLKGGCICPAVVHCRAVVCQAVGFQIQKKKKGRIVGEEAKQEIYQVTNGFGQVRVPDVREERATPAGKVVWLKIGWSFLHCLQRSVGADKCRPHLPSYAWLAYGRSLVCRQHTEIIICICMGRRQRFLIGRTIVRFQNIYFGTFIIQEGSIEQARVHTSNSLR